MTFLLLAFAAGALALLSPCILPVLPFVLTGSGRPLRRGALPLLLGMAGSFALFASLTALGGGWVLRSSVLAREFALVWLAVVGMTLLFPGLAERLAAPVTRWSDRLLTRKAGPAGGSEDGSAWSLAVTGMATGLLWAPCAGPVLGLVLAGAVAGAPPLTTLLRLLAFGAGAACVMALVIGAGRRLALAARRTAQVVAALRRVIGALVLLSVAAVASGGWEQALTRLPSVALQAVEQQLLDGWSRARSVDPSGSRSAGDLLVEDTLDDDGPRVGAVPVAWWRQAPDATTTPDAAGLPDEGRFPGFPGATGWISGGPLNAQALRGKVVVVNFWTYSCINCLRTLPHMRAWARQYASQGLVAVGIHTPEFAFEKDSANVAAAVRRLQIDYPVAQDDAYDVWRAFGNSYWPAIYVIDAKGRIRHHQFGEGGEARTEQVIRALLAENGAAPSASDAVADTGGVGASADLATLRSPESYIGYAQATAMASTGGVVRDRPSRYRVGDLALNDWGLSGTWTVGPEYATLAAADGAIAMRFHARDLHLVLGVPPGGAPMRFVLTIDGAPPGDAHGLDVDAQGRGVVTSSRLYQLVRQPQVLRDRRVEIRFLDPGVRAYAFTFG